MTKPEQRAEQRRQHRQQEAIQIEASKTKLAERHQLLRNEKFEIAWRISWDYGHAAGFSEVENYFEELVPLLKP